MASSSVNAMGDPRPPTVGSIVRPRAMLTNRFCVEPGILKLRAGRSKSGRVEVVETVWCLDLQDRPYEQVYLYVVFEPFDDRVARAVFRARDYDFETLEEAVEEPPLEDTTPLFKPGDWVQATEDIRRGRASIIAWHKRHSAVIKTTTLQRGPNYSVVAYDVIPHTAGGRPLRVRPEEILGISGETPRERVSGLGTPRGEHAQIPPPPRRPPRTASPSRPIVPITTPPQPVTHRTTASRDIDEEAARVRARYDVSEARDDDDEEEEEEE